MSSTTKKLKQVDHMLFLKSGLSQIVHHPAYKDVQVICKDGALHYNRLIIGLIFTELKDENTAIIPDVTVKEIIEIVDKMFDLPRDGLSDNAKAKNYETEKNLVSVKDDERLSSIEITDEIYDSGDEFRIFEQKNDEHVKKFQKDYKRKLSHIQPPKPTKKRLKNESSLENLSCSKTLSMGRQCKQPTEMELFTFEMNPWKTTKRIDRCRKCENCKFENCGECHPCINMKQFGGTGSFKKACMARPACLEGTGSFKKACISPPECLEREYRFIKQENNVVCKLLEDESVPIVEKDKDAFIKPENNVMCEQNGKEDIQIIEEVNGRLFTGDV